MENTYFSGIQIPIETNGSLTIKYLCQLNIVPEIDPFDKNGIASND
jgi:hypothetical protein